MRDGSHTFTSYRQKLLSKGAEKLPRVIAIATARDRIVLKGLSHFLSEVFPQSTARTAQEKVDLLKTQLASGTFSGFVRVDIENFYGSVDHAALEESLRKKIRKREALALLFSAIRTPTIPDGKSASGLSSGRGVPQGLAISNALAEIAVGAVDTKFSGRPGISYIRYVDDVIILCDRADCEDLFDEIAAGFAELGLKVHPLRRKGSKSSVGSTSASFEYLGYVFNSGIVSVREESISRLDAAIARVLTRYKHLAAQPGLKAADQAQLLEECRWKLNLVITGCTYRGSRRGWVAYFSQINDLGMLKRLDAGVIRNLKRFHLVGRVAPKSFLRTYWRIAHPGNLPYIPNFDRYTTEEKRSILIAILGISGAKNFTALQVEQTFDSRLWRLVKDLERHIGEVS